MATRPTLFTRGLSSLSQSTDANSPNVSSPAEQRSDALRNFQKTMRPLHTHHVWDVYFDRQAKDQKPPEDGSYQVSFEKLDIKIESVQDFWRYNNNFPVDQIKMRESVYLFKNGFKPVWEDRRNILGGSWTFRVPKANGSEFWDRIQLMAISETLQSVLDEGDQLCGVGLSVRFNSHLITIWHRDASKQKSIDGMLACVMEQLPENLRPKPDNYFYKKHSDHAGFKAPPELQAVLDSQKKANELANKANANDNVKVTSAEEAEKAEKAEATATA